MYSSKRFRNAVDRVSWTTKPQMDIVNYNERKYQILKLCALL